MVNSLQRCAGAGCGRCARYKYFVQSRFNVVLVCRRGEKEEPRRRRKEGLRREE